MHHPGLVHVGDGRHQVAEQLAGLRLVEQLLPLDALQQLPAPQQLHHQVGVELQGGRVTRSLVNDIISAPTLSICIETERGPPGRGSGAGRMEESQPHTIVMLTVLYDGLLAQGTAGRSLQF